MKENNKKYSVLSLLSILGLVTLILLSPCKVRNSIQSALDVPQTDVSNKSITTLNNSCTVFEVDLITSQKRELNLSINAEATTYIVSENVENFNTEVFLSDKGELLSYSEVPLYILYKNFKVYL